MKQYEVAVQSPHTGAAQPPFFGSRPPITMMISGLWLSALVLTAACDTAGPARLPDASLDAGFDRDAVVDQPVGSEVDAGTGTSECDVLARDCPDALQCVFDLPATENAPECQASTGNLSLTEVCSSGSECEGGMVCVLGFCLPYCRVDTDCSSGRECHRRPTMQGVDFGFCN